MEKLESAALLDTLGMAYFRELATFGALSDEAILALLEGGEIYRLAAGEKIERVDEAAEDFQVVLQGETAFYKRGEDREVLTRHFRVGEQIGFDLMIGLIPHNGTDIAVQESILLHIGKAQFYHMHVDYPADFGLLMINLARELSREIALLEDVIVDSAGSGSGK